MKAWLKFTLGFIVIVVIAGAGFAWWVYHKPHRDINNEIAVKVEATALLDAFKQNEKTASAKYNDKVLELSGIVKEASKNEAGNWVVNIENTTQTGSITVAFSPLQDAIQPFDSIAYKGICAGYFPEDNSVVINEAVLLFKSKTDTTKKITVSVEPVLAIYVLVCYSNDFNLSMQKCKRILMKNMLRVKNTRGLVLRELFKILKALTSQKMASILPKLLGL